MLRSVRTVESPFRHYEQFYPNAPHSDNVEHTLIARFMRPTWGPSVCQNLLFMLWLLASPGVNIHSIHYAMFLWDVINCSWPSVSGYFINNYWKWAWVVNYNPHKTTHSCLDLSCHVIYYIYILVTGTLITRLVCSLNVMVIYFAMRSTTLTYQCSCHKSTENGIFCNIEYGLLYVYFIFCLFRLVRCAGCYMLIH